MNPSSRSSRIILLSSASSLLVNPSKRFASISAGLSAAIISSSNCFEFQGSLLKLIFSHLISAARIATKVLPVLRQYAFDQRERARFFLIIVYILNLLLCDVLIEYFFYCIITSTCIIFSSFSNFITCQNTT